LVWLATVIQPPPCHACSSNFEAAKMVPTAKVDPVFSAFKITVTDSESPWIGRLSGTVDGKLLLPLLLKFPVFKGTDLIEVLQPVCGGAQS